MGDTVVLAICFPLVIVGMALVIMWGMSIVGPHRNGRSQDESEQIHSREVARTEKADGAWSRRMRGHIQYPSATAGGCEHL
jgi:hypothetical protein